VLDGLYALTPAGAVKPGWPVSVGAVQGLAVADAGPSGDVVFYAANTATTALIAGVSATTAMQVNTPNQCNSAGATTYSGIGLIGTGGLRAVGVLSNPTAILLDGGTQVGHLCAFSPTATDSYVNGELTANFNAPAVPGAAESATSVAIDNTRAYVIGRGGRVYSSTLTGSWTSPVEARQGTNNGALFTGSALFRDYTGATWELALSGGSNLGNLYKYTVAGGFTPIANLGTTRVGQPALLPFVSTPVFYLYAQVEDGTLSRFDATGAQGSTPLSTFASTAPVLGAGWLGYVVDGSGRLTVFPTVNAPAVRWTASLPLSTVAAPPTLDCVRQGGAGIAGARVGVLYVASTSGEVTAVLVDSPKLEDVTLAGSKAPWPKYQRTAGNAGNIDTTFELNPGCP
jgi:hypothetical protein